MKRFSILVFLSVLTALCFGAPRLQWEATGLIAPESVVFDASRQEYYVSNMGTFGEGETPHDGFIARLSADGKLLEQKWIMGLDNPKGLALSKGRLYVGDDIYLTEMDPESGKIVGQYKPDDGPGDFNDCTADREGNVYVCCGRLHTIFRLHEGKFEPWVKLDPAVTGGLNGLLAEKDRLMLGGWSRQLPEGKEEAGHLSYIVYKDKSIGRIGTQPICHIDGLEPDGLGGYTVCDWLTGHVFHVSPEGVATPLMTLTRGSADHTYRADTHQLIIPLMLNNVVRAYAWNPADQE